MGISDSIGAILAHLGPKRVVQGQLVFGSGIGLSAFAAAAILYKTSAVSAILTVSQGVVTVVPDGELQRSHLIKRADKALYGAKDAGRNAIVVL